MMVVVSHAPPEEGLLHHEPACAMLVDDHQVGVADLYVTESAVVWGGGHNARNVTLLYPRISLHAIQRDPAPLIYMMIDYKMSTTGEPMEADDEEYDPDDQPTTIVKFVPQNVQSLPAIYEALNQGQALHPDQPDEDNVLPMGDFMVAELVGGPNQEQPEDATEQMEKLTIEQNGKAHTEDDEDDDEQMYADA